MFPAAAADAVTAHLAELAKGDDSIEVTLGSGGAATSNFEVRSR